MNRFLIFKLLGILLFPMFCNSQINPRMVNPDYAQTVLYDDFSSNQEFTDNWNASVVHKDGLYNFIDTSATIILDENNEKLNLRMIRIPGGYTLSYWEGTYTTNFISGEVYSEDYFGYGIFECEATFAYNRGSFPAFWLYNDSQCAISKRNEIDIVECKVDHSGPTLDNCVYYYPNNCNPRETLFFKRNDFNTWDQTHIFKCIYTPEKIEFWVDNTLLQTVTDNGDYKYPDQEMRIILSQQVTRYENQPSEVITPQTSSFNWVKAKEFFLAPEITFSSDVICTSGTASMDVDQEATNISWSLSPAKYFTGATTGSGKNASFTVSSYASGQASISYTFEMPSGETFTAEESFWTGPEEATVFSPFDLNQNAYNWYLTTGTPFEFRASLAHPSDNAADYIWTVWDKQQQLMTLCSPGTGGAFTATHAGYYTVNLKFNNGCGWGDIKSQQFEFIDGGGFLLMASPNPTNGETTISIEKSAPADESLIQYSDVNSFDENEEWDLAVYDNVKNLKLKKDKLKGKSFVLKTHGWKEGIYMIRAKYKNEIIQGKLIVKK